MTTTRVGGLDLPVPAGGYVSELSDPTLLALLAYLGHWLKVSLDPKLAQQTPTSADACPVANRHPWDPGSTWIRAPLPALYAWEVRSSRSPQTVVYDLLEREIRVRYIFEELIKPDGIRARHGLLPAVARIFATAGERNRHSTFGYAGAAPGTPIASSANWLEFQFVSGQAGFLSPVPGGDARAGGDGSENSIQRGFPAYDATFLVWERVAETLPVDPDDVLGDMTMTLNTHEAGDSESVAVLERILESPDGSESL